MGIGTKIIGGLLLLGGILGVMARVPNITFSSYLDSINPFVRLGLFEPSVKPLLPEFIVFMMIGLIGVVLLLYKDNKQKQLRIR